MPTLSQSTQKGLQQDGAAAHTGRLNMEFLRETFSNRLISRLVNSHLTRSFPSSNVSSTEVSLDIGELEYSHIHVRGIS